MKSIATIRFIRETYSINSDSVKTNRLKSPCFNLIKQEQEVPRQQEIVISDDFILSTPMFYSPAYYFLILTQRFSSFHDIFHILKNETNRQKI